MWNGTERQSCEFMDWILTQNTCLNIVQQQQQQTTFPKVRENIPFGLAFFCVYISDCTTKETQTSLSEVPRPDSGGNVEQTRREVLRENHSVILPSVGVLPTHGAGDADAFAFSLSAPTGRLDHSGQPHWDPQAGSPAAGEPGAGPRVARQRLSGPGEVPQPGEEAWRIPWTV